MNTKKGLLAGLAVLLLAAYNGSQSDLAAFRTNEAKKQGTQKSERYGPSLSWLDRLRNANTDQNYVKLDFNVLSSMMVAGLASGFKSQVANLLWMKSDEYWHKGLLTRQVPLMEAVVTLDPQFIDAWSTAGWHWAYNIYADVELDPRYKILPPKEKERTIRQKQDQAVRIGLDYLKRGSEMNPDTYRLWFEHGWTRAQKAGIYDEETVELYKRARAQKDARNIERQMQQGGKTVTITEQGMDLVGRTIGHIYESRPDVPKSLDWYANQLLKPTPQERALLEANGTYWARYGSDYTVIADVYNGADPTTKAQIKKLVPDVERLVAAVAMRGVMGARENGTGGQPTGAYVTIAARYLPTWRLMEQGKLDDAIKLIIGVMNADPKYHLKGLPVLGQIMELRGDAPAGIQERFKQLRRMEQDSSQDIGLHLLATLYEKAAAQATDPQRQKAYQRLAYETWYRSRSRDQLDFYAKARTRFYEDKYGFNTPQAIVDAVKASRKSGQVIAAPETPPNVSSYYQGHDEGHAEDGNTTHGAEPQRELPKELR